MTNVQFGSYTPSEDEENLLNIEFIIFFDGTLNNKQNTKERENATSIYKKNSIKTWKEKQVSEKKDTSYDNDWSNIARMSESCKDEKYSIYISGVGTEDRKKDDSDGFAFGSGKMGIRDKVLKGCEEIVKRIKKKLLNKTSLETLTLDVCGFSRGAAAARNFVYEINKIKYKPSLYTPPVEGGMPIPVDSDGNYTDRKEFPARGYLGLELLKAGITVEKIKVRFLGIYDTVSSYNPSFSLKPNFKNDVEELHLDDITTAKNIVHFIAADEHRENFDLTNVAYDKDAKGKKQVPVYYGTEKVFPGVHSDIGGSYLSEEEWVREIATDWLYQKRLKPVEEKIISEGWYNKKQLFYLKKSVPTWIPIPGMHSKTYWALSGKRFLWKSYSYIPLKFMVEKANAAGCSQLLLEKINQKYDFSKDSLLLRVEKRLRNYVFGNGKSYEFKWFHEINKKYKGKENDPNYKNELSEQKDLRTLRNKYLHWSADRYAIGMDPDWYWNRKTH